MYDLTGDRVTSNPATLEAPELLEALPDDRFDRVIRLARHVLGVPIAAVSFVDNGRRWMALASEYPASSASLLTSLWARTILEDDALVVPDIDADPRFAAGAGMSANGDLDLTAADIRFFAGIPLIGPERTKVGVLWAADEQPRQPSPDQLDALRDLGNVVERALSEIRLATLDELTGTSNRRGLVMVGHHVLATARRTKRPAALLYVDLDNLKQVNDTLGHAAGDRMLQATAVVLTEGLRAADIVARVGGDEFCVLLSDTAPETIPMLIARLHARLEELNRDPGREFDLAMSEGWVVYDPEQHVSIEELIEQGDAQMYEQKQAKRMAR